MTNDKLFRLLTIQFKKINGLRHEHVESHYYPHNCYINILVQLSCISFQCYTFVPFLIKYEILIPI